MKTVSIQPKFGMMTLFVAVTFAAGCAWWFMPYSPNIHVSDFQIVPIQNDAERFPSIRVGITNNDTVPTWLQGSGDDICLESSHARCFEQKNCIGQNDWGDMRAGISLDTDELMIAAGQTTFVEFPALPHYNSARLYLEFKDSRRRSAMIHCGDSNFDELATLEKETAAR